jgi:hypothetical protein
MLISSALLPARKRHHRFVPSPQPYYFLHIAHEACVKEACVVKIARLAVIRVRQWVASLTPVSVDRVTAANIIPPASHPPPRRPYGSQTGFGDLVIGPFLQSGIMTLNGRPFFSNQLEFTLASPTGAYDKTKIINPGHNTWDLNPFWAAILFWTPKLTSSIRAHYLWSSRNPATG